MDEELLMPSEVINPTNYPGLYQYQAQVQDITNFAVTIADAVDNYTSGVTSTIDADPGEVSAYITKARNLCVSLSGLQNVPYTVLLGIRDIQAQLQTVLYATTTTGNGGNSPWQPIQS